MPDQLYDAIFKRRSVRRYEPRDLDEPSLADVRSFMAKLEPMLPGMRTELRILGKEAVRGMFKVDAPHFLAIFSEPKEGHLANAGFMLQQMDLFLSSMGIGSCWQGGPKLAGEQRGSSDLEFVIMLAFGRAAEEVHRTDLSQFQRKPLASMTSIEGRDDLLEAARLAPSGMNNQPWFFAGGDGVVRAFGRKSLVADRMNRVSVGISLCHLWLAGVRSGASPEVFREDGGEAPRGYSYVASMRLNDGKQA